MNIDNMSQNELEELLMTDQKLLNDVKRTTDQVKIFEAKLQKAIELRKEAILKASKGNTQMEIAIASGLSIQTIQRDLRDARKQ